MANWFEGELEDVAAKLAPALIEALLPQLNPVLQGLFGDLEAKLIAAIEAKL